MWPHSGGATRCLCDALVRLGHRLASAASVARRSLAASSMRLSCHLTRHGHAELAANPPLGPLTHRQAHLEWPCSCSASSLTRRASATFISVLAIRWFSLLFRANPFSRAGCFRNQIWMSAEGVATRSVEAKRSERKGGFEKRLGVQSRMNPALATASVPKKDIAENARAMPMRPTEGGEIGWPSDRWAFGGCHLCRVL